MSGEKVGVGQKCTTWWGDGDSDGDGDGDGGTVARLHCIAQQEIINKNWWKKGKGVEYLFDFSFFSFYEYIFFQV